MKCRKKRQDQCRIVVAGSELVKLKRHAHQIPECPGLDRRIQRYEGKGPPVVSLDELEWLIAVLDAVLNDPKGLPMCRIRAMETGIRAADRRALHHVQAVL